MESLAVRETVLPTGMGLVEMPVSGRLATAISVVFAAGSRHEREREVGAAHLLEHLAFKGTENYPSAAALSRAAEYLGTELAGSSSVDYVEFSTFVRAESAAAAAELLTDVTAMPRLAEADLEAERTVILQEIADDDDDPGARADDLLMGALFAGHRLAKDVAGEAADVRALTRDAVLAFRDRQWTPTGGLVAIAGNLDHIDRDSSPPSSPGFPTGLLPRRLRRRRRSRRGPRLTSATLTPSSFASPITFPVWTTRSDGSARTPRSSRTCSLARWARACMTSCASSARSATGSAPACRTTAVRRCCSSAAA
jgi:Insulinase (Peptidase family M16)